MVTKKSAKPPPAKPNPNPKPPAKAAAKTKPNAAPAGSKSKGKAKAVSDDESDDSFNSSESESEGEGESGSTNEAAMLAMLEAHGRALFGVGGDDSDRDDDDEDDDEESTGNGNIIAESDDEGFHTDDGWGAGDGFVSDSEDEMGAIDAAFMSAKSKKKSKADKSAKSAPTKAAPAAVAPVSRVPEVVFAPGSSASASLVSKSEKRAFMKGNSAKMMGIQPEQELSKRGKKRARDQAEEEEEASNLRLDQTLHSMLLTSLLPDAEADAAARPVEKRNALSGRLLELASYSLPGEGGKKVRGANLSSHPANVRTGLMHAAARREEKARAESEAAGSWVKGVGGLGDLGKRASAGMRPSGGNAARGMREFGLEVGKKKGMAGKKNERARGLGMGVGSYKNGTLTFSEREIERVNNLGKGGVRKKGGKKKK